MELPPPPPPVTIMDGSMGRQLCLDGMPQDDLFRQIWSARALVDDSLHHLVVNAHKSYIEAGASILTTNAYGVQPTFYRRAFPENWEANMLRDAALASKLAVQARAESGKPHVQIFGCLPPLCESHRPDLFAEFLAKEGKDFVVRIFGDLAKAALKGGCDALMLENMVSWEEAELALEASKNLGVSLILSMEGGLRDMDRNLHPERAPQVAKRVIDAKLAGAPIEALGFSCTEPETILECLQAIQAEPGLSQALKDAGVKLSAHANLNDRREAHQKGFNVSKDNSKLIKARQDLVYDGFQGYVKFCKDFVNHGCSYVGGCCGCGPLGITSMREACQEGLISGKKRPPSSNASLSTAPRAVARALAPTGVLRVGINLANSLLVKDYSSARRAEGVVPSLATELAGCLGVDIRFIPCANPSELVDAVNSSSVDVAFLAADANRASQICFSPPYVEIPASYLAAPSSKISKMEEVDKKDVRIASFAGTGYDNWLVNNIKHASIVKASSRAAAVELVSSGKADVLAGVREHLLEDATKLPGSTLLGGAFMFANQAIGTKSEGKEDVNAILVNTFLENFVAEAISTGLIQTFLERYEVVDKLTIAKPPLEIVSDVKRRGTTRAMRICVLGCGAMGSIYAALLAEGGNEVWAVDVWEAHVQAINEHGLRVEGPHGDKTVKIQATSNASEVGLCDLVIIATKASGVEGAAKMASTMLNERGVVLTIQNGLGAGDRISQFIDPSKVLLGIASNFGACLKGPGHAEHKSMKLICLGELVGGKQTERLDRIVEVWKTAGFTVQGFADIHVPVWEKFICNCTYSGSCTLTGMTVGEVLDNPAAWNIALTCAQEAFAVARKQNIQLSFDDVEKHVRQFGESVRDARPSVLQDHMAKRRSEIDYINGAVPVEAAKVGMTALANQIVADALRAKEALF